MLIISLYESYDQFGSSLWTRLGSKSESADFDTFAGRGKPSSGPHNKQILGHEPSNDAVVKAAEDCVGCVGLFRDSCEIRLDPIRRKQVRRCSFPNIPRPYLLMRPKLRCSIVDGMHLYQDVFKFQPLGEPPGYARQAVLNSLKDKWNQGQTRLLFPTPDLMASTVRKLVLTKAPAILLIPEWPK